MRSASAVTLAAMLVLAFTPAVTGAASSLPLGKYRGTTSDGHAIHFTVARLKNPASPRNITNFSLDYDIAGCAAGSINKRSFAAVYYGKTASRRGDFERELGRHSQAPGKTGELQLRLTGSFTSAASASGSFRIGVLGRCPLDPAAAALRFTVKRTP